MDVSPKFHLSSILFRSLTKNIPRDTVLFVTYQCAYQWPMLVCQTFTQDDFAVFDVTLVTASAQNVINL